MCASRLLACENVFFTLLATVKFFLAVDLHLRGQVSGNGMFFFRSPGHHVFLSDEFPCM